MVKGNRNQEKDCSSTKLSRTSPPEPWYSLICITG